MQMAKKNTYRLSVLFFYGTVDYIYVDVLSMYLGYRLKCNNDSVVEEV